MTTSPDLLPTELPDLGDLPLDTGPVISDEEYSGLMHRLGITGDEQGTSVSAFNSSI